MISFLGVVRCSGVRPRYSVRGASCSTQMRVVPHLLHCFALLHVQRTAGLHNAITPFVLYFHAYAHRFWAAVRSATH